MNHNHTQTQYQPTCSQAGGMALSGSGRKCQQEVAHRDAGVCVCVCSCPRGRNAFAQDHVFSLVALLIKNPRTHSFHSLSLSLSSPARSSRSPIHHWCRVILCNMFEAIVLNIYTSWAGLRAPHVEHPPHTCRNTTQHGSVQLSNCFVRLKTIGFYMDQVAHKSFSD